MNRPPGRRLGANLLAGLGPALFEGPEPIVESKAAFESGGKTIRVERFEPKREVRHPVVPVVSGAGGLKVGGPLYRMMSPGQLEVVAAGV